MENMVTERAIKIVVERHSDGYVAYPLGIDGVVVGEGDSYEEALENVRSAISVYFETFGDSVDDDMPLLEAFLTETRVAVECPHSQ